MVSGRRHSPGRLAILAAEVQTDKSILCSSWTDPRGARTSNGISSNNRGDTPDDSLTTRVTRNNVSPRIHACPQSDVLARTSGTLSSRWLKSLPIAIPNRSESISMIHGEEARRVFSLASQEGADLWLLMPAVGAPQAALASYAHRSLPSRKPCC